MEHNELASYYFHQGTNFTAYDYLGCHKVKKGENYFYTFRTWAPGADRVGIVSDFFGWSSPVYMSRVTANGIWEFTYKSKQSLDGQAYKYSIERYGKSFLKADPYAFYSKGGADGASIIFLDTKFKWQDKPYLSQRKKNIRNKSGYLSTPINIYEVHLGSFIRHSEDNSYYSYREIAPLLVSYIKYMGYTHVEFLPIAEHPFDGSWGYQVGAFYAPTSRFGNPDDFRYLINELHKNGIGVIIDWVPAHFPKDAWGLYEFDGGPLYEYQGDDRKESETWGTRFFDLGREEVQSFLISNALYFFREFHVDGLRVDAVASMLYLDYDRAPGKWIPNSMGGRENLEAIAFFQKLNTQIYSEFPEALMIAEESGTYGGITRPVYEGGLGFNLKWNMGFANDFYDYLKSDPLYRKDKHKALNFPILYAFTEKFVLPVSHDEVVHGKLSLIDKMFGKYEDKFKQMRSALLLMMTFPGKKLLFMGTEFAQFREWDYENSLEWFMLDYPNHKAMREYVKSLNRFYLETPELWEIDFEYKGFEWILSDESDKNTVAYKRYDTSGNSIIIAINFSGITQTINIPTVKTCSLSPIFLTESENPTFNIYKSEPNADFTEITLPAFYGAIFVEKNKKIKIKI